MTPPEQCPYPPHSERCMLAEDAADRMCVKVFAILGVDIKDPESVREFQEDLRWGRAMRETSKDISTDIRKVTIKIIVTGVLMIFGIGFAKWIRGL